MKSRIQAFSIVVFMVICLSKGGTGETFYRNVRVRTADGNETGISVVSRIHGGAFANEGQFPYMVFLLSYASEYHLLPHSTCSASLIHTNWVLTAAHCVTPAMIAVAGKANLLNYWINGRSKIPFLNDIDEKMFGVQERKVHQSYIHPMYSTATNERDFALLHVDLPFIISPSHWAPVQVLPISEKEMSSEMQCNAIGWGLNDNQKQTFRLMFASVTGKTTAMGCHYLKRGPFICLGMGGAGICKGDSGSPLVCQSKAWGVASFSLSPTDNADCFSDSEEYYSEIYKDYEWIKEKMSNGTILVSPISSFGLLILAFFHIFVSIYSR